eukprot:jgi/Chrzof1/6665/Cz19g04250.t1
MTHVEQALTVAFRGHDYSIPIANSSFTLGELVAAIQVALHVRLADESIKLLGPKNLKGPIHPYSTPSVTLQAAGIQPGMRLMLLASSAADVEHIRASKDLPRLASFDYEARRSARRRKRTAPAAAGSAPLGRHYFSEFQTLSYPGLTPPPSHALALLHRLAADQAISKVMASHNWMVGLLSEMPPEGKVGVSAVCVLGYNVNQGQEISLRLRTDDLRGFRKYARIRETLVHELAHMVWGDHDNNFKELNSQLLREVAQHDAAANTGGHLLAESAAFDDVDADMADLDADVSDPDDVMHVTAKHSGQTLRQLAGGVPQQLSLPGIRATHAAAAAALHRLQQQQQQPQQRQTDQAPAGDAQLNDHLALPSPAATVGSATYAEHGDAAYAASLTDAEVHYDPDTAAAEDALRRLGSLEGPEEQLAQEVEEQLSWIQEQQHQQQQHSQQQQGQQHEHTVKPQQHVTEQQQQQLKQQQQHMAEQQQRQQVVEHQNNLAEQQQPQEQMQQVEQGVELGQQLQQLSTSPQHPVQQGHDTTPLPHDAVHQELHQQFDDQQQQQQQQQQQPKSSSLPNGDTDIQRISSEATGSQHPSSHTPAYHQDADLLAVAGMQGLLDDPAMHKLQQVQASLSRLAATATAAEYQAALETVLKVLTNVVTNPSNAKYERVRLLNAAFHQRAGRFPEVISILQSAGFSQQHQTCDSGQATTGSAVSDRVAQDPVLVYTRKDPGLLWLVVSAVRQQMDISSSVAAKLQA